MKKRILPYLICTSLVAAILFVKLFVFTLFQISGTSMEPTFQDGAYVIVHKNAKVQRGDIVLARDPAGSYIIKRVVGLSGDHICITVNSVYVNFKKSDSMQNCKDLDYLMEIDVPENSVFLLGDNRIDSTDYIQIKSAFL